MLTIHKNILEKKIKNTLSVDKNRQTFVHVVIELPLTEKRTLKKLF